MRRVSIGCLGGGPRNMGHGSVLLYDEPDIIEMQEGERIPGEVSVELHKTALDSVLPGRLQNVHALHDKLWDDESPVLIAYDKVYKEEMLVQVFTSQTAFKRVKECSQRCFKLRGMGSPVMSSDMSAIQRGMSSSGSSPSLNGGLGIAFAMGAKHICRILELHEDSGNQLWVVIMESPHSDKSSRGIGQRTLGLRGGAGGSLKWLPNVQGGTAGVLSLDKV